MVYFDYKLRYYYKLQCNWNIKIFTFLRGFFNDNYKSLEIEYKKFTSTTKDKSNTVEKSINVRRKNVRFAVGMIVTHCHDCNDRDGVIIGWDCKCDKKYLKKLYKNNYFTDNCIATAQVYVEALFYRTRDVTYCTCYKVHYILLTENKNICYVEQDAIRPCQPKKIDNIEIGKYFSSFEGTHYVPNENLRKRYPKDTAKIANILARNGLI
ncbi:uncharacterized protein LOC126855711 [Cataglyphis hispanica]|uniref:uncharacterized protein LOC126855711 n=1 Tax=Cataglyphis hispanica TaxID=1086592 RepID=UPI00217F5172|nr:uncharacterized protein LOC126855711 [Cataglyphis hispanica]